MASVTITPGGIPRPRQNWILSPIWDVLLIVAAPAIALLWALAMLSTLGAVAIIGVFVVFNVAHHMPTFIRIYGDQDLLKRFRWRLLLGPIFPFGIALAVVFGMLAGGLSVEHAFCLWAILLIWDPWHFIMQHYGFMRIYDRHNRAPARLASRMDLMISATWFIFIMVSVVDWLPQILYDLTTQNSIPVLLLFDASLLTGLKTGLLVLAVAASFTYAGYLVWCKRKGYFVSLPKVLMVIVTFGIMYLTYVPNAAMDSIMALLRQGRPNIPGWTFPIGFATVGMVHVTQYLAIVWKYNRGLVQRGGRSRQGAFTKLFQRGGLAIAAAYVAFCLAYGFLLTDHTHPLILGSDGTIASSSPLLQGLIGVLIAVLFTSTILHYYFDGFIWKVRHAENRASLALAEPGEAPQKSSASWWENANEKTPRRIMFRQGLYFAVPMLLLAITYTLSMSRPAALPLTSLNAALAEQQRQPTPEHESALVAAVEDAEQRLAIEKRMAGIRPRADHFLYIHDLTFKLVEARRLRTGAFGEGDWLRQRLGDAVAALEGLLSAPGDIKHREMEQAIPREAIQQRLITLRRDLARLG